ncbi:MAG: radical SAM protein [Bacteroidales bacterium]|nr:radical SAM protein [Bacteroidales bacterium]
MGSAFAVENDLQPFLFNGLPVVKSLNSDFWLIFSYYSKRIVYIRKCTPFNDSLIKAIELKDEFFFKHPTNGSSSDIFQFIISVTNQCNLACTYCFLGKPNSQTILDGAIAKESICVVVEMCKNLQRNLNISYFGGEPTLEYDLVKELTTFAINKDKSISFSITTNGTFSEKWIPFFKDYNFKVSISMDALPDIQNKFRPFSNNNNSHDFVLSNIRKLLSISIIPKIRITVTKDSVLKMPAMVTYLAKIGIKQIHFEVVSISDKISGHHCVSRPNKVDFVNNLIESIQIAKSLNVQITNSSFMRLFNPAVNYCDGSNRLALNPDHSISSCIEVNNKGHNLFDKFSCKTILDKPEVAGFSTIEKNEKCITCFAKFICGGGCPSRNYYSNFNVKIPDEFNCYVTKQMVPFVINDIYNSIKRK